MRAARWTLPALALGSAALLLAPPREGKSFSLLGTELGLSQRDFRIFNNFNDVSANDNQAPHPSFPGYAGATLAIWKASVEWQSALHGDGSGDPLGGNLLGDGGANFDPSFQGLATEVGSTDDNIHSPLFAFGGGVFAFAEGPASDGWRIRYFEDHIWRDGPGNEGGADLQGIATHEYGHAIGLGHSSLGANLPTMNASTPDGLAERSIETDDRTGLEAIYGEAGAGKPRITGVSLNEANSILTVTGLDFSATNNTAWFTQVDVGGNGEPVKVFGLASTLGGTRIDIAVPVTAGPGDVLIQKSGNEHASLSNAWPIDPKGPGPGTPTGGEPFLSTALPAQLTAVAIGGPQVVQLLGQNLLDTQEVWVGAVQLFEPQFKVIHDGQVKVAEFPLLPQLGTVSVRVVTLLGEASVAVQVFSNDPPILDLRDSLAQGGEVSLSDGLDITLGGQAGDVFFLEVATSDLPSPLPGLFEFDIGNNFTALWFLASPQIAPSGHAKVVFGLPQSLAGVTLHFQAAVWDIDFAEVFPLTMTNVETAELVP